MFEVAYDGHGSALACHIVFLSQVQHTDYLLLTCTQSLHLAINGMRYSSHVPDVSGIGFLDSYTTGSIAFVAATCAFILPISILTDLRRCISVNCSFLGCNIVQRRLCTH